MQLVVVKFLDPATYSQWVGMDEMEKSECRVCFAAGWLLERDEKITKVGLLIAKEKDAASCWIVLDNDAILSFDVIKDIDWEVNRD